MKGRVIVIGASARAARPLLEFLRALAPTLLAAVLVVRHASPTRPGFLPDILSRVGTL